MPGNFLCTQATVSEPGLKTSEQMFQSLLQTTLSGYCSQEPKLKSYHLALKVLLTKCGDIMKNLDLK